MVVPHVVALIAAWWRAIESPAAGLSDLPQMIWIASYCGLFLSPLTLAFLGGNIIACERADRSAEFLAYQPVSRFRILASKLILVLLTLAVIWLPNLLIMRFLEIPTPLHAEYWTILGNVAFFAFVFFCAAWMLSSMLANPGAAVLGALITPLLVGFCVLGVHWMLELPYEGLNGILWPWTRRICLVLAPVCFVTGTWYYLRRVEP